MLAIWLADPVDARKDKDEDECRASFCIGSALADFAGRSKETGILDLCAGLVPTWAAALTLPGDTQENPPKFKGSFGLLASSQIQERLDSLISQNNREKNSGKAASEPAFR